MSIEGSLDRGGASEPGEPPETGSSSQGGRTALIVATALAFVVAAVLRFSSPSHLWLDEALTVNIARLPLADIPAALRHDGAPPLFYVMLHAWGAVFGTGDAASRALPGLIGVASIPLAYLCGRRIGAASGRSGTRSGVIAALVFAVSPFAIRYSAEVRMYALAIALVFIGDLAVRRAVDTPTLPRLVLVTVTAAALLYTYYWCAFLVLVVATVLAVQAARCEGRERRTALRVLAAVGCSVLFVVPWVPSLLWQLRHTGTPWGSRPTSPVVVVTTFTQFGGGHHLDGRVLTLVLGVFAVVGFLGRAGPSRPSAGMSMPGVRWECLVGVATLAVGLAADVVGNSAYQARYAAVVLPFFVLAAAHGVALVAPRLGVAALAVIVVFGMTTAFHEMRAERTQAGVVAATIRAQSRHGDVVVYCPDQLAPDTSRLLPASGGLRQYTFPAFSRPERIDWTDYARRNRAADPGAFAARANDIAGDATIWYVWSPGYRTLDEKCEQVEAALSAGGRTATRPVSVDKTFEHMNLTRLAVTDRPGS